MEKNTMSDSPVTPSGDPIAPPTGVDKDWKAEAEKWQHFSRQHEANWKKATAELATLTQAGDADRALTEAKEAGKREALEALAAQRVQDRLDVAAARAGVDLTAVSSLLDHSRLLKDGQVNETAIAEFITGLSAVQPKEPKFAQGLGFGPQSDQRTPGQLTREDVQRMTPREVAQARKEGRLDGLMRGET